MAKTSTAAYDKLNPMQKQFVNEYMTDFNATQAYIRAGYSKKGAESSACRMLRVAKVKAAVTEQLEAAGVTPERITIEIAAIAFGQAPSRRVTGANGHSEQDRLAALDKLSKILGMVTDKQEVTQVGPVHVMFDDGTPAERDAAAERVSAERRKAHREGK